MAKVELGGVEYDVFADVDFADAYLAGDVARAAGWSLRNPEAKIRGLISGSRLLLQMPWCEPAPGFEATPPIVQEVTAMLASDLLAKPTLFANAGGNSNVKIAKAGSAMVEFFSPVEGGPPLPRALWTMLFNAGLVGCKSDDATNAGPFVSGISDGCRPLGGRFAWDYPIAAEDHD